MNNNKRKGFAIGHILLIVLCIVICVWVFVIFEGFLFKNQIGNIQQLIDEKDYAKAAKILNRYSFLQKNTKEWLVLDTFLLASKNYPNYSSSKDIDINILKQHLIKLEKWQQANKYNKLTKEDIGYISFAYFISGNVQKSIDMYKQLIPTDKLANLNIARIYSDYLKVPKQAEPYYLAYLATINDEGVLYKYSLIIVQDHYNHPKELIYRAIDNLLKLSNSETINQDTKAEIYLSLGDLCFHNVQDSQTILGKDCDSYYNKAEQINPTKEGLLYAKAYNPMKELGIPDSFLFYNANSQNLAQYKSVFNESLPKLKDLENRSPDNYWYKFLIGYILEFNNYAQEAREYFQDAISDLNSKVVLSSKEQARLVILLYHLSRIEVLLGNLEQAKNYMNQANIIQPNFVDFVDNNFDIIKKENELFGFDAINKFLSTIDKT